MVALFDMENPDREHRERMSILNDTASTSAELNEALRMLLVGLAGNGRQDGAESPPELNQGCTRCSKTVEAEQ